MRVVVKHFKDSGKNLCELNLFTGYWIEKSVMVFVLRNIVGLKKYIFSDCYKTLDIFEYL